MKAKQSMYAFVLKDVIEKLPPAEQGKNVSHVIPTCAPDDCEVVMGVRVKFRSERLGDGYVWVMDITG